MKKITLTFCFSLAVFLAMAQIPTVATPTLLPQNPTAASIIKVVTKVYMPSSMVVVDANSFTITGQQIKIKGCYSPGMLPFAQSYTDTLLIGQLPVGNYQIKQIAFLSTTQQHCTPLDSSMTALSFAVSSGTVSTGINQAQGTKDGPMYVYPNPCNTTLFIAGISPEAELSIFSITGARMSKELVSKNILNIENLPAGLYFMIVNDRGKTQTLRFIKADAGQ